MAKKNALDWHLAPAPEGKDCIASKQQASAIEGK